MDSEMVYAAGGVLNHRYEQSEGRPIPAYEDRDTHQANDGQQLFIRAKIACRRATMTYKQPICCAGRWIGLPLPDGPSSC